MRLIVRGSLSLSGLLSPQITKTFPRRSLFAALATNLLKVLSRDLIYLPQLVPSLHLFFLRSGDYSMLNVFLLVFRLRVRAASESESQFSARPQVTYSSSTLFFVDS